MLRKCFSKEPQGQFLTNLVGNVWGMGIHFVQIYEPNKGQNKENSDKSSKIFSWITGQKALIFGMEHPCIILAVLMVILYILYQMLTF